MTRPSILFAGLAIVHVSGIFGLNSAQAVLVQHNSETIFFDDFESAPEVVTDIVENVTADADPVPVIGSSWHVQEPQGAHRAIVTSDSTNTAGPAYQGSNFFHARTPGGSFTSNPWAYAVFPSVTGGDLHFELAYRNNNLSAGPAEMQFALHNGNAFSGPILRGNSTGTEWLVFQNNVSTVAGTGLAVAADQLWHTVAMDVDLETGLYSVTIDGVTSATFDAGVSNITTDRLYIGPVGYGEGTTNPRYDFDSITTMAVDPDHNGDGFVDVLDYVVWRMTAGDNPAGYEAWSAAYGTSQGSGASRALSALAGVPEPATAALTIVAVALIGVARPCRSCPTLSTFYSNSKGSPM